jgi:hypothetical protein
MERRVDTRLQPNGQSEKTAAALMRDRSTELNLLAAAIQRAIFGLVSASVDRAGATGFGRATGTWRGKHVMPRAFCGLSARSMWKRPDDADEDGS